MPATKWWVKRWRQLSREPWGHVALAAGTGLLCVVVVCTVTLFVPWWSQQPGEHVHGAVAAAYREILGREPDAPGLASYAAAVAAGHLTLEEVRAEMEASDEHREMLAAQRRREKTRMHIVETETEPPFHIVVVDAEEDRVVSGELLATGFYTADVTNLLHTIFADLDTENKDKKLFIDAGANIGYYTMLALANGLSVIAFEPQERARRLVRMSAAVNGFPAGQLTLRGKALSSRVGKWFRVGYLHGNWGGLGMEEDATGECAKGNVTGGGECAESATLDDEVQSPVFFLKMDIEGAEAAAMRGAAKMFARWRPEHVLLEFRPDQVGVAIDLLERGYTAYNVREWDWFGQDGAAVFATRDAPRGRVDLSKATPITEENIHAFSAALAERPCELGCFTDLYFARSK